MAEHYELKYRMKWLDVPRMSQGNTRNSDSNVWCGRTSVAMVYNYYQMVKDKPAELIINRTSKRPYELVFDDGHIVGKFRITADSPEWKKKKRNNRYMLSDVLKQQDPGWKATLVYRTGERSGAVTHTKMLEILAPVFKSIDDNNPVVIYSSISATDTLPRHIVVVAGYRLDEAGDVWLLINDPARPKNEALALGKDRKQAWSPGPALFPKNGARYWVRALRFFEPNTLSKDPTDLFCDHADQRDKYKDGRLVKEGGFCIIINEELVTEDSPYSHIDMGYVYPHEEKVNRESAEKYYRHTEKQHKGGYFPLGTNTTWHGGVHLFKGRGRPVAASWRGEIVAVRLLEGEDAIGAYGSRNFILVRHKLTAGDLYRVKPFRKLVGYKVKRNWDLTETPGGKVVEMPALKSTSLIGGDELEVIGDDESQVKIKALESRLIRVDGYYVHIKKPKKKDKPVKTVKFRAAPNDSAELILDLVRGDELKLCDPQPEDEAWRHVEIEKFANRVELVTGYTIKKVRRGVDHLPLRTAPLENAIFWLRNGDTVELVDPQNPGFEDEGGNRWYKVRVKSFGDVKEAARYKISRSTSFWSKPGEDELLSLKPGDVLEPDRTFDVQQGKKYLRYPMVLKEFAPGSKTEDSELRSEAHAGMIGRFGWVARERMKPEGVGPRSTLFSRFQAREGWILPRKKNLKEFGKKRAEEHSELQDHEGYVRYVRANLLDRGPDRRDEYKTGKTGYVAVDDAALERLYVLDEKHKKRLEGKPFYFLYMHVNNEPLEQSNERLRKVKWLMSSQVVEYEVLSEFVEFEGAPTAEAGADGSAESTATPAQSSEPAPAGAFTLRRGDVLTVVKQKEREDESGRWDRVRIKELAKGGDLVGFEAKLDDYVMHDKASKKGKHVLALRDGDRLALVNPDKPFVRNAEGVWCAVKLAKFADVQDDIGYVVNEKGGSLWSKAGGPWSDGARKIRLRAGDVLELDRSKRREETKTYTWDYVKVVSLAGDARAHQHRKLIGKSGWIAPRKREGEQKKFRADLFHHWRDERKLVFADKQGATGWVRWEPSALEPIETKSDRRAAHQGMVETEGLVRYDSGAFEEIKGINEKLVEQIRSGEIVKLEDVKVEPGETVWTYGLYGRPDEFSDMIHWEVFSEEEFWSVIDGWEKVRDDDADYNMDCETIFRMVPPVRPLKEHDEPKLKNDRGLTAQHVTQFYASDPDAQSLRTYSCRFVSEWGLNLDSAIAKLKGKFKKAGIKERTRPYLWWDDVFGQAGSSGKGGAGADGSGEAAGNDGLDPHVWHYNPIAFMELFGDTA